MRTPKVRTVAKSIYTMNKRTCPDIPIRVTRSLQKFLDNLHEFIILENYRCMPLLGDEEKVPNWDVHIYLPELLMLQNKFT